MKRAHGHPIGVLHPLIAKYSYLQMVPIIKDSSRLILFCIHRLWHSVTESAQALKSESLAMQEAVSLAILIRSNNGYF